MNDLIKELKVINRELREGEASENVAYIEELMEAKWQVESQILGMVD
ncbi:hypothetical protein [Virgibacillus oceani]|uniref:Uncharacterized protein n=1 Tax=Virgibacillus oceani TaxID=1479511 RepID=A0A917LXZ0_9BACI|nr:hypothetical protein [Virgibacillus oceani]GGG64465.1 hypothetical protein GCM10011398_05070 [Virgibacillus oceani]